MLSIQLIRTQPDFVKTQLQIKNFIDLHLIDDILSIDEQRRALMTQTELAQARLNELSKQIGELLKSGNTTEAESAKAQTNDLKKSIATQQDSLQNIEKLQEEVVLRLPNLPHHSVPKGTNAEHNEIIKSTDTLLLPPDALPHWDLATKYDLFNFELGNKVTGAGFPFYKGKGAKLQRALISFFLDRATEAGYTEYLPPLVVNQDSAYATGQLPDKEGQMYHAQVDNFYLIPTAEVPLTNIYRNEIVDATAMPIKLCGFSSCFRREAGSYGKDVRGLNRLHQFEKVEIVQVAHPDQSYAQHEAMVNHVEQLLISLELPYRLLRLCGGDMSFAAALTIDFEVYSAAQQRWLEVSSVSNFETFQTNRLKLRYKDIDGKNKLAHTLNGSALALPRIVAALLENHQTPHGINIPKALQPYTGFNSI